MKVRAEYKHLDYPYLYDGDKQTVAMKYGPVATPQTFIFDQARKLQYEGRIDDTLQDRLVKSQDAPSAIDALLAGQPIAVARTPAFGCATKWKSQSANVAEEMAKIEAEPVTVTLATGTFEEAAYEPHRQAIAGEFLGDVVRPASANFRICRPPIECTATATLCHRL